MKNTENESDESTKTTVTAIKAWEDVKSTPEKSRNSVKNKSSALLQDVDEDTHDKVLDWPETPVTKIRYFFHVFCLSSY